MALCISITPRRVMILEDSTNVKCFIEGSKEASCVGLRGGWEGFLEGILGKEVLTRQKASTPFQRQPQAGDDHAPQLSQL